MASRFWVGGTGTWDASDTTHWAASSGGAGGQSVPGSADTVTLDGSSGGGTVTVNTTVTVQSITCGAFTGTLDFSANNNSVTLSASTGFNGSGTGTRTVNLGNGTWNLTSTSAAVIWNLTTTTNLTFNANSSTIKISGSTNNMRTFAGGGKTYNNLELTGAVTTGGFNNAFADLKVNAGGALFLTSTSGTTATSLTMAGSSSSQIFLTSDDPLTSAPNLSVAAGSISISWVGVRGITFTGGATFTASNSFDLGKNSGITITAPSAGSGGGIRIAGHGGLAA